jgi:hypothetical protein
VLTAAAAVKTAAAAVLTNYFTVNACGLSVLVKFLTSMIIE